MATITEDYVSFETAKLLKEKGFMEGAIVKFFASGYDSKGNILNIRDTELKDYPRPTIQMAIKWLREVHNIHIDICSNWDAIHWLYQVFVITPRTARNSYVDKMLYTSYERACEVAIQYSLKNLI